MKRHVPFTSVSADPEIQRMRDVITSDDKFTISEDGTICPCFISQLITKTRYGTCLWEKKFIRKMNEFHFEQKLEGWGKRSIDMTRKSDNRILVSWIKEDGTEKKVVIDEHEWNCFISHLFNEIEIDCWSPAVVSTNRKLYLPDGRPYREVPALDGGEWTVRIIGEDRNHEFGGINRVPARWGDFISYINKIEDAIDLAEPNGNF